MNKQSWGIDLDSFLGQEEWMESLISQCAFSSTSRAWTGRVGKRTQRERVQCAHTELWVSVAGTGHCKTDWHGQGQLELSWKRKGKKWASNDQQMERWAVASSTNEEGAFWEDTHVGFSSLLSEELLILPLKNWQAMIFKNNIFVGT